MSALQKTKRLRGKYQITKNTFVTCYLDVLEASNTGIRSFIGLKQRADTVVPVGTKIFFNAEPVNRSNQIADAGFDIFSITVQQIEDMEGQPLLVCSPINKETRNNLRAKERKTSEFEVTLAGTRNTVFIAKGGTTKGLTLHYKARRALLSLALKQSYNFAVEYRGNSYTLPGQVKHIQYDWKTHEHIVGVYFPNLTEREETVLSLLLDPNYTVQMRGKQTVDTALGKISAVDED